MMYRWMMLALLGLSSPAMAGPSTAPHPPRDGQGPRWGMEQEVPQDVLERVLAEEDNLLAFVKERDPERHARLLELRESSPELYQNRLVQIAAHVRRIRQGKSEHSEELLALHDQLKALADAHFELKESAQAKAQAAFEADVRSLVEQIFELKQTDRRERLEEMKARIARVEEELAKQEAEREALVQEHLERALRELERQRGE